MNAANLYHILRRSVPWIAVVIVFSGIFMVSNDTGIERLSDFSYKQPLLQLRLDQLPSLPPSLASSTFEPTVEIGAEQNPATSSPTISTATQEQLQPPTANEPPKNEAISPTKQAPPTTLHSSAPIIVQENEKVIEPTTPIIIESTPVVQGGSELSCAQQSEANLAVFGESSYRAGKFDFGSSGLIFRMRDESSRFGLRTESATIYNSLSLRNNVLLSPRTEDTAPSISEPTKISNPTDTTSNPSHESIYFPNVSITSANSLHFNNSSHQIRLRTLDFEPNYPTDEINPINVAEAPTTGVETGLNIMLRAGQANYMPRSLDSITEQSIDSSIRTVAQNDPVSITSFPFPNSPESSNWSSPESREAENTRSDKKSSKQPESEEEKRHSMPAERPPADPRFLPVRASHPLTGFDEGARWYAPGLRLGRFDLRADFASKATFTDNLYLAPKGAKKKSDTIITATPTFAAASGEQDRSVTDTLAVAFRYSPSVLRFVSNQNENTVNHDLSVSSGYRFSKLGIVMDQHISAVTGGDVERGDLVNRRFYTTTASAEYEIGEKTSIELSGNVLAREYQDAYDSTELLSRLYLNYELFPKLITGVGGTYGIIKGSGGSNQSYQDCLLRGVYIASEKTSAFTEGGISFRHFDNRSKGDTGLVFRSGANYQFDPRTAISADAYRRQQNSNAFFGQNINITGISLGVSRQLYRLRLALNLGYEQTKYESSNDIVLANRKDNFFFVSPSAMYALTEWWDFGLDMQYRNNESSESNLTFDNTQFGVSSNVRF